MMDSLDSMTERPNIKTKTDRPEKAGDIREKSEREVLLYPIRNAHADARAHPVMFVLLFLSTFVALFSYAQNPRNQDRNACLALIMSKQAQQLH